ncbi:MAG: histidine kinase [Acidobacteriota bacterium]
MAIDLLFLVVYIFGAFVCGSSLLLWLRQANPIWQGDPCHEGTALPANRVNLAMFVVSTAWFILHTIIEFRDVAGVRQNGWFELAALILSFAYPPLIMHTVYQETPGRLRAGDPWRWGYLAMYGLSPLVCAAVVLAIFDVLPRPEPFGAWIGGSVGVMFLLASAYATWLMALRGRPRAGRAPNAMRRVMMTLFVGMGVVFLIPFVTAEPVIVRLFDHSVRAIPLVFFIAAVYFENRFEFYDLVIKRAALLVTSIVLLGVGFLVALPLLERLPEGAARPWLFAIALAPLAVAMPWLHARLGRELDRLWFGREFTPVEAVKHVLAAMQPATDERSLVGATSALLSDIFDVPIAILLDGYVAPDVDIISEVSADTPSGARVRFAVLRAPGARTLLSEDLTLLHSLAGVFGFMLENVRLQRKRQEQEHVAQMLRLQSSRSELKALRAQINPHFFFNALNAIASLIHTDPARADAAVEQLAEVFRYTLRRSDSDWAPLDQELAFARAYLDVEQARFGSRLAVAVDVAPGLDDAEVPSMLLQTLVENAVKHGISQTRAQGRIAIRARLDDERLALEVRDTGPGPSTDAPRATRAEGESFGLRSVRERLRGHFGDDASLSLERDEAAGETVARIVMPLVTGDTRAARVRSHAS